MKHRDDADEVLRAAPPARESGRTLPGIEPVRLVREEPPPATPRRHPRAVRPFSGTRPVELVKLDPDDVLERLHTEVSGMHVDLDKLGKLDEKLDRYIEANEAIRNRLFEERTQSVQRDQRLEGKLDALTGKVDALPDHTLAVGTLQELVGQPAPKTNLRDSQLEELTDAQLKEQASKGTGLHRLFGQLALQDRAITTSIAKAAGRSAGAVSGLLTTAGTTAPVWMPPVVEAIRRAFGG